MEKMQDPLEIKDLLEKAAKGQLSEQQRLELLTLLDLYWVHAEGSPKTDSAAHKAHAAIKDFMRSAWQEALNTEQIDSASTVNWDKIYQEITRSEPHTGASGLSTIGTTATEQLPRVKKNLLLLRWVAAAVGLLLLSLGAFWALRQPAAVPPLTALQDSIEDLAAPSSAKAVLVLAGGHEIALDSSSGGLLATEAGTAIRFEGKNSLNYTGVHAGGAQLVYNELRVKKGSRPLSLHLSDGSTVWLNVGSSLRFPTAFSKSQRKVTLKGEGYFEVSKDKARPFVVEAQGVAVKVLGTHFDISSYADEPITKVTLLEGAVEVTKNKARLLLEPRQQAQSAQLGAAPLKLNNQPNIEEVLSWRSGDFLFSPESDFNQIMREIARWYDVELVYTAEVHPQLWGSVPRTASIKEVLQILEATGGVKFSLIGRQLTVMPAK